MRRLGIRNSARSTTTSSFSHRREGIAPRASKGKLSDKPFQYRFVEVLRLRYLKLPLLGALLLSFGLATEQPSPALAAGGPLYSYPGLTMVFPAVTAPSWSVFVNGIPVGGAQADIPVPTASTTKIMTAYVLLTQHPFPLTRSVTVTRGQVAFTKELERQNDWVLPVKAGQRYTDQELLQALLLRSYDNVAVFLANQAPGGEAGLVRLMNKTALALGLHHAHFADVSGVSPNDRVSPQDMTRLTTLALAVPGFSSIVAQASVTLPYHGTLKNIDSLLFENPDVTGVKTGWTPRAGYTLVFSAQTTMGGQIVQVVGTLDGDPNWTVTYQDASQLIDGAFQAAAAVYPLATREDFVTALAKALNLNPAFPAKPTFSDVPVTDPDYGYIEAAFQAGWVTGVGGGLLDPAGLLTRAQAAKMEVMALGRLLSASSGGGGSPPPAFADEKTIPAWALPYTATASKAGLFVGYEDGTFRPNIPLDKTSFQDAIAQFQTVSQTLLGQAPSP